ncbi:MAG TPA: aminotransferase class I/II-fold pyridoxal phosphate-dependent enzyme [Acidobacteriota bacterium]|nr:aminotransferase class I/II-fold pyridoxal phosphate-dependent enzyme [Acidobacteriota bacterium]
MAENESRKHSAYMQWAKTQHARYNAASSGVQFYPLKDLNVRIEDIEISGPSNYGGYEPLHKALANKCAVDPECVAVATGTSMANHLVMAAMLNTGDEILIEHPTYDPILAVARYLGAKIKRFQRTHENQFVIEPDEIRKQLTPETKLIVITDLHNPSGVFVGDKILKKVGTLAKEVGAKVLVDEVYRECLYTEPGLPVSVFHLGNEFISTNSLTKAYGLNGLRCGWVLAEPELIRKVLLLNDLYGVIPAHSAERLSVIALEQLPQIAARAKSLLDENRQHLNRFFDENVEFLDVVKPKYGTIAFPKLKKGDASEFCARVLKEYETLIVPGSFFEMSDHFRVGIGGNTADLVEGLSRISRALK